jgi:hypothetical protein
VVIHPDAPSRTSARAIRVEFLPFLLEDATSWDASDHEKIVVARELAAG